MADGNPLYGGPYLDQHVPDPNVPLSMPSANTNMPIIATDSSTDPSPDQPVSDASADTRQTTEVTAEESTVSDNPDSSVTFTPLTDAGEHL